MVLSPINVCLGFVACLWLEAYLGVPLGDLQSLFGCKLLKLVFFYCWQVKKKLRIDIIISAFPFKMDCFRNVLTVVPWWEKLL